MTYSDQNKTFMAVVLQQNGKFYLQNTSEILTGSQPVVFDINGDLVLEILQDSENGIEIFKLLDSITQDKPLEKYLESEEGCLSYEKISLSSPHSVGFVDFNKDCLADIFLTVTKEKNLYFEVWLNMQNGKYCKVYSEMAPEGTQQVSFADIDRNGIEDIVFPVCIGENCEEKQEIHIFYLNADTSNDCSYSPVSVSTLSFADLNSLVNTESKQILPVSFASFYSASEKFPITLRFGDFNLDGYPDALVTVFNSSQGDSSSYIAYLENSECGDCHRSQRNFTKVESGEMEKLENIEGALFACFFDLDDNGILDLIVVSHNESEYKITSFYNNFLNDAFHLKALALDGYGKGEYSSAFPGAVFMFTLTELDMSKVIMHSTQMPQTAYYALNTPYCVFGLGRTNSYIEEFYAGMPVNQSYHRAWTPIIPNSYLIVSTSIKGTSEWFLELFASPTDKIGIIIGVCLVCMAIIGIIVVYNYLREKREDKQLFEIDDDFSLQLVDFDGEFSDKSNFSTCPSSNGVKITSAIQSPNVAQVGPISIEINATVMVPGLNVCVLKLVNIQPGISGSCSMGVNVSNTVGSTNSYTYTGLNACSSGTYVVGSVQFLYQIIDLNSDSVAGCLTYNVTIPATKSNVAVNECPSTSNVLVFDLQSQSLNYQCNQVEVNLTAFVALGGTNVMTIAIECFYSPKQYYMGGNVFYFNNSQTLVGSINNYNLTLPATPNCKHGDYYFIISLLDIFAMRLSCSNVTLPYSSSLILAISSLVILII